MAEKLCKEQQMSFSNNMGYSDFIADIKPGFFAKLALTLSLLIVFKENRV